MKTLIETHNITLQEINSLNDSERKIFESLCSQFNAKQQLSDKQNDLLTKIIKREFDISNIKYTKMYLYKSYFYRPDWRGDMMRDSRYVLSPVELVQEQIIDAISEQYGSKSFEDKYQFEKTVAVPTTIKQLNNYANYYMFKFEKLMMKLPRARSINSKYKIIRAIKTILSEEYADSLISDVLDRKHWN